MKHDESSDRNKMQIETKGAPQQMKESITVMDQHDVAAMEEANASAMAMAQREEEMNTVIEEGATTERNNAQQPVPLQQRTASGGAASGGGATATAASRGSKKGEGWSCAQCGIERTPLKRRGPDGPSTLCNACGMKYSKGSQRSKDDSRTSARNIASREQLGTRAASSQRPPNLHQQQQLSSTQLHHAQRAASPPVSDEPVKRAVPSERKAAAAATGASTADGKQQKRKRNEEADATPAGSVENAADGSFHVSIAFWPPAANQVSERHMDLGPFDTYEEASVARALVERALNLHSLLPKGAVPSEVPHGLPRSLGDDGVRRVVDTTAISMHEAGLYDCVGSVNGVAMRLFGIEASIQVTNEAQVGSSGWSSGYFDQAVFPQAVSLARKCHSSSGERPAENGAAEDEPPSTCSGEAVGIQGDQSAAIDVQHSPEEASLKGAKAEDGAAVTDDVLQTHAGTIATEEKNLKRHRKVLSSRADCAGVGELMHATLGITPVQAMEAQKKIEETELYRLDSAAQLMRLLNGKEDWVRHNILRGVFDIRSRRLRNQIILAAEKAPLVDDMQPPDHWLASSTGLTQEELDTVLQISPSVMQLEPMPPAEKLSSAVLSDASKHTSGSVTTVGEAIRLMGLRGKPAAAVCAYATAWSSASE